MGYWAHLSWPTCNHLWRKTRVVYKLLLVLIMHVHMQLCFPLQSDTPVYMQSLGSDRNLYCRHHLGKTQLSIYLFFFCDALGKKTLADEWAYFLKCTTRGVGSNSEQESRKRNHTRNALKLLLCSAQSLIRRMNDMLLSMYMVAKRLPHKRQGPVIEKNQTFLKHPKY